MNGLQHDPLDIVQEQFWRHTDRNPTDASAVLAMMNSAIKTLDGPHAGSDKTSTHFIQGITKSLDPNTQGGMGLFGLEKLHEIGRLVTDKSAKLVEQWGALALLGLLAMTRNPSVEENADKIDPTVYRTQFASTIACDVLARLAKSNVKDKHKLALATAFIDADCPVKVPTVDVAIQLMDLLPKGEEKPVEHAAPQPNGAELGNRLSEPRNCVLLALSQEARSSIGAMTWIRPGFNFRTESIAGRDIFHDGQKVAEVFDLTVCNTTLNKYFQQLQNDPETSHAFWKMLADAVVMTVVFNKNKGRSYTHSKVTFHAFGNNKVHNDKLLRGYFSPLGTTLDGIRAYGLVAAFRTKDPQEQVLRLLKHK